MVFVGYFVPGHLALGLRYPHNVRRRSFGGFATTRLPAARLVSRAEGECGGVESLERGFPRDIRP